MSTFCWPLWRIAAWRRGPAWQIRRVQRADADAMHRFVDDLGTLNRRSRFHGAVKASPALAAALVEGDAVWGAFDGGALIGEARFVRDRAAAKRAELAIAVADGWQGRGVAAALLARLRAEARRAGVRVLHADVMGDNTRVQRFLQRHGFRPRLQWDGRSDGDVFECRLAALPTLQRMAAQLRERLASVLRPRAPLPA